MWLGSSRQKTFRSRGAYKEEFAIHNKASKKSIEILEKMCEDYEKNIWRPS